MELRNTYTLTNQTKGGQIIGKLFMKEEYAQVQQRWATADTPMLHGWGSETYYYLEKITGGGEEYKYDQAVTMLEQSEAAWAHGQTPTLPTNYIVLLQQRADPPNTYVLRTGVVPHGGARVESDDIFGDNYDRIIVSDHSSGQPSTQPSPQPQGPDVAEQLPTPEISEISEFLAGGNDSVDGTEDSSGDSSGGSIDHAGGGKRKKSPKKRKSKKTRKRRY